MLFKSEKIDHLFRRDYEFRINGMSCDQDTASSQSFTFWGILLKKMGSSEGGSTGTEI